MIQYEKLKVNSELTDMLTATISHDMRTPLNAIITVSKNVMHDLKHQSRLKRVTERYLKIVTNSALLLSYLVNDLTDLFKIRTGRFVPYEQEMEVRELVFEVIDIFKIQSKEKGLDLKLLCDEFVPSQLRLDSTRFK
jgi:signal transduction histidine kinase